MNAETYQKPAGYTACFITYILYIVGPLTVGILWLADLMEEPSPLALGILWLAGLIVAITSKSGAAPAMAGHLDYAKRLGIIGLIGLVIIVVTVNLLMGAILTFIFASLDSISLPVPFYAFSLHEYIRWLLYAIWWIWSLVESIRGLNALTSGAGAPGTYQIAPVTNQEPAGHTPWMDGEPDHHTDAPATNQEPADHTSQMDGEPERHAGAPATNQKPAGYTACLITYILYMVGPFTFGILWLAGLIVAIVSKGRAAPAMAGHLGYATRVGINGIIGYVVAVVITIIEVVTGGVIAWLPVLIWWIWCLVKCIRGLSALTSGADAPA